MSRVTLPHFLGKRNARQQEDGRWSSAKPRKVVVSSKNISLAGRAVPVFFATASPAASPIRREEP